MTSLVNDLVSRRPPKWARQLRRMLGMEVTVELDRQLQNGWERLIGQALPVSREREKVRYQVLMEGVETRAQERWT